MAYLYKVHTLHNSLLCGSSLTGILRTHSGREDHDLRYCRELISNDSVEQEIPSRNKFLSISAKFVRKIRGTYCIQLSI